MLDKLLIFFLICFQNHLAIFSAVGFSKPEISFNIVWSSLFTMGTIILSISFLFAQGFEINQYYGTININEEIYDRPFLGGLNKPKIQWVDWDNDGDNDLFILDEDGSIKFYINNSVINELQFDLMETKNLRKKLKNKT